MHYEKHFLEENIQEAKREIKCIEDCLMFLRRNIRNGKLENAQIDARDINKSLAQLRYLAKKKEEDEEVRKFIKDLTKRGISSGVIFEALGGEKE